MIHALLWLLAVVSFGFSPVTFFAIQANPSAPETVWVSELQPIYPQFHVADVTALLQTQAPDLHEDVIKKVLKTLQCVGSHNTDRTNVLTVIDYSLPSNEKRLWVFDLVQKKLLFHTYVSHGIKSGTLSTNYFSNKYNSKASSFGVYRTDKAYYGREGLSLRLNGLDRNFNDNASNRSIVMHGGWYMDEHFIKKYGRPGRSWGCPAVPLSMYQPIINTIKENSLIVVYYPNDDWFAKSKFLTCDKPVSVNHIAVSTHNEPEKDNRADVLFAEVNKGGEDKPILVMRADNYTTIFHTPAPLGRMLRRQINQEEYIALSTAELSQLVAQHSSDALHSMYFVIPKLRMVRGYYETEMHIVNLGAIREIRPDRTSEANNQVAQNYTVSFEKQSTVRLKSTNRFIRWLGL